MLWFRGRGPLVLWEVKLRFAEAQMEGKWQIGNQFKHACPPQGLDEIPLTGYKIFDPLEKHKK